MNEQKIKKDFYYRNDILDIFPSMEKTSYREDLISKTISFSYGNNGVTFDQLERLSSLLQTKMIDFEGIKEDYQYSEWTSDTSYSGDICCSDVVFDPRKEYYE